MNIQKISKLAGVLGVRGVTHSPRDIVEECTSSDATVPHALNVGMQAVEQLGDCRVIYDNVTVIGQRFDEANATLVVALTTGHNVAKSMRRLMRGAVGLKRKGKA